MSASLNSYALSNSNNNQNVIAIQHNANLNTKTSQLNKVTQVLKPVSILSIDGEVFNTRVTKRLNLSITLFVRRPINSKRYLRQVSTINVSRYGALVLSHIALEVGAELEVTLYKLLNNNKTEKTETSFNAKAIVRHIRKDSQTNKYFIGLDFQQMFGKWVVI
jgi:hypothetical protein